MSCCEKCFSTYTEKDYPSHTIHEACINPICNCHTPTPKEEWLGELNDIIADYERVLLGVKPVTYTIEDAQEAFVDLIKGLLASQNQKLIERVEGMKRKRKPTHGTCCTCQECGYPNDVDCECERNRILDDILKLMRGEV